MEIGIVLIIALVVFGPKRLPDLGKSLGKGIREFKGSVTGETDDAGAGPSPPLRPPSPARSPTAPGRRHRPGHRRHH